MAAVWELFEQGADPLRRAQEGLGLGLTLVRHIVEAHYGTIEIETTPGQGSTFTVKLPKYKNLKQGQAGVNGQEPEAT